MSLGAYAFVQTDWRRFDYPLDLWVEWHAKIFDRVVLVTYADDPRRWNVQDMGLPDHGDKVLVKAIRLNPLHERYWSFYVIGKAEAQRLLDTEWKMLLDVDEFVYRPHTGNLDPTLAYAVRYHNLYGSLEAELPAAFPVMQFRLHRGPRDILGDGANVEQPWAAGPAFDCWHTGAARDPAALAAKWKVQIDRELAMGWQANAGRQKWHDAPFEYGRYAEVWPGSRLVRSNLYAMPEILLKNRERFTWWTP